MSGNWCNSLENSRMGGWMLMSGNWCNSLEKSRMCCGMLMSGNWCVQDEWQETEVAAAATSVWVLSLGTTRSTISSHSGTGRLQGKIAHRETVCVVSRKSCMIKTWKVVDSTRRWDEDIQCCEHHEELHATGSGCSRAVVAAAGTCFLVVSLSYLQSPK
jgi:hypothetical protein